ncbi:SpoIIE family protein phosphatase [Modestobacter sp. SYSU DS0657]
MAAEQEDVTRAQRWAETTDTALVCFDRDFRFVYANAAAEKLVEVPRSQLLGRTQWEVFPATLGTELERAYRHAMSAGERVLFEQYYPPQDMWYRLDVGPVPDGLDVSFADVTEGKRLGGEQPAATADEAQALLDLLTETSAALSATLDVDEAVHRLARLLVPRLADWCIVSSRTPGGQLQDLAVAHRDPRLERVAARYARHRVAAIAPDAPAHQALATGEVITVGDGRAESIAELVARLVTAPTARRLVTELAPGWVASVPLMSGGRVVGLLSLYRDAGRPGWTPRELSAAADVAGRAGTAVENARLFTEQAQLAEGLQRSLLTEPPEPEHAEIAVRYLPAVEAAQVGGDWYDAFVQPSGTTMLVIGDVVGHDVQAAAAMGQLRSLLRGIATHSDGGPAEVLAGLDRAMAVLRLRALATAAVARFEQDDGERGRGGVRLRWSNAGHLPPMAIHPDGSVVVLGDWRADLLLGVDAHAPRRESVLTLERGATVFFFTDGLVEDRRTDLDAGVARLRAALTEFAALPLPELCDGVVDRLVAGRPDDDVALVAVRLTGPSPDAPVPPTAR